MPSHRLVVALLTSFACRVPSESPPRVDETPPPVVQAEPGAEPAAPTQASFQRAEPVVRSGALPKFPELDAAVERVLSDTIAVRRQIHENPELGERETETAKLVAERLQQLGYEVKTGVAKTGVVAVLDSGQPGGVLAWRADMDALPVTEETGLPFASRKTDEWNGAQVGVMHACGHDVHTSVGLGLAKILVDPAVRPNLRGKVMFLFQPAEEGVPEPGDHGAKLMVAEGAIDDPKPDAVMGLHIDSRIHVGDIAWIPEGALAAADRFEIQITGKQAHGAYPQDSVDPVVIASEVVLALQTIASRNVDTRRTAVITVGEIHGGNRFNIIPGLVKLVGTIRTHESAVQELVHRRVHEVSEGIAAAHGARANVKIDRFTPVTYNHPELLESLRPVVEGVLGKEHIVDDLPHMGAEDFAYFAQRAPGLFYFIGVSNPEKGIVGHNHTPQFMVDEDAIGVGLRTSAALVLTYLHDLAQAEAGGEPG